MSRIGLIGSAGRKDDASKISRDLYRRMVKDARDIIHKEAQKPYELVSGGAAFSDHLAITLYLLGFADSLTLYFPCLWIPDFGFDSQNPAGKTANYYHNQFSTKLGSKPTATLQGIQKAINKGAVCHEIEAGFHARNILVGKDLDLLIAYTFSSTGLPKNGGTSHCWKNSNAIQKIHRNLGVI